MLRVLALGPWLPSQVVATTVPDSRPTFPEIESIIEKTWNEHRSRLGDALFDGPMCRLKSWRIEQDRLLLQLSQTSYRIFLGTNLCHADLAEHFGASALANAVGMSAALRTADNKLVMGRRNGRVAYYPFRIHPFAGALEPQDIGDISGGIRRELAEELSLADQDISNLRMLAIIADNHLRQPEFIFTADTSRTAAELRNSLDEQEHESMWSCDTSEEAIAHLLGQIDGEGKCGNDSFTPVGVGTILMFGRDQFGQAWLDENMGRFID